MLHGTNNGIYKPVAAQVSNSKGDYSGTGNTSSNNSLLARAAENLSKWFNGGTTAPQTGGQPSNDNETPLLGKQQPDNHVIPK